MSKARNLTIIAAAAGLTGAVVVANMGPSSSEQDEAKTARYTA